MSVFVDVKLHRQLLNPLIDVCKLSRRRWWLLAEETQFSVVASVGIFRGLMSKLSKSMRDTFLTFSRSVLIFYGDQTLPPVLRTRTASLPPSLINRLYRKTMLGESPWLKSFPDADKLF
jgi:hypothetical protein